MVVGFQLGSWGNGASGQSGFGPRCFWNPSKVSQGLSMGFVGLRLATWGGCGVVSVWAWAIFSPAS